MNKKLMAVAIAGALGAPALAFAQASTVQIFGQMQIEYAMGQDAGGSGSTAAAGKPTRDAILNTTSYWGIKGEESLGGGLTAWFNIEQNVPINGTTNNTSSINNPNPTTTVIGGNINGNVAGSATSGVSPGLTCDRNCALGLKGGFGNVYMGSWYTPKFIAAIGAQLPSGATTPGGWAQIMGNAQATGNNVSQTTSFARRQLNSLSYESPNMGGFTINGMISASNEKTAATAAAPGLTPRLWGVAGRYDNGPLYVSLGYERHNDYNPATAINAANSAALSPVAVVPAASAATYQGGNDTGWELRATYLIGGSFKLIGAYERLSYTATSGLVASTNLDHSSWLIAGDWNVSGPHNLRAMYERGNATSGTYGGAKNAAGVCASAAIGNYVGNCGQGDTGSNLWYLEYAYAFSKRTSMYADYSRMNNDRLATTAINTMANANAGANQSSYGVGIRHKF